MTDNTANYDLDIHFIIIIFFLNFVICSKVAVSYSSPTITNLFSSNFQSKYVCKLWYLI